jgi:hypothetical protein
VANHVVTVLTCDCVVVAIVELGVAGEELCGTVLLPLVIAHPGKEGLKKFILDDCKFKMSLKHLAWLRNDD